MPETYIISDHHFAHANILKFEKEARPFADLNEMAEHYINVHNETVSHDDRVIFVGDVVMGSSAATRLLETIPRLNGKIELILGNHDRLDLTLYKKMFRKVHGCSKNIALPNTDKSALITHIPVHPAELGYGRCQYNIHGHIHSRDVLDDKRYYNVCVEKTNGRPVSLHNIARYFENG